MQAEVFQVELVQVEVLSSWRVVLGRLGGRLGSFLVLLGADLDILRGPGVSFWPSWGVLDGLGGG